MKFSLVMGTINRTNEVEAFIRSLVQQEYHDVELIVVDQNGDGRLDGVLSAASNRISIRHLRSEPGLSRARNVGIRAVTGDIVAFPDDDCIYPPGLLRSVVDAFQKNEVDGVTGRAVDPTGGRFARFHAVRGFLTKRNAWERATSFTMFFRRELVEQVGPFDETLGVGAGTRWGAGEDIDYPIRAVKLGLRILYVPDLLVWHPSPVRRGYEALVGRASAYGAGIGRVWRKHDFEVWLVAYYLCRPLAGAAVALARGQWAKAEFHWRNFRGRWQGWRQAL